VIAPPNGFVSTRVLKLNVGFLLNESPGTSRQVDFDVPPITIDQDLPLAYLRGTLRISRATEGILVQGVLESATEGECRRCLAPITVPLTLHLEELFAQHPNHNTVFYVAEDGILDLTPLLREEAIVAIPIAALCRPDCAGLCDQCGHNLNFGPCECQQEDIDPRLAVLLQLRNPDSL
jgi:uncharacterized protein